MGFICCIMCVRELAVVNYSSSLRRRQCRKEDDRVATEREKGQKQDTEREGEREGGEEREGERDKRTD